MGGKTSTAVKQRWESKAYTKYLVRFRNDTDRNLIDYLEKNKERMGTSNIFRDALEMYIESEKGK